ncbi:MAG: peptidylprolyl isomerase [Planctomycetaceae bacterium]|nr:peptidylprolyl isomerase [Planctomycetaceae bacterium]
MTKRCLLTFAVLFFFASLSFGQNAEVVMPKVVAEVNGDKIMESDLAGECLAIFGENELSDLVKKSLIQQECAQKKITVSQQEINNEVARMAGTFKFSTEEWLKLLEDERGITAEQYMQDIIYPLLAIGKIAGAQLTISEEDIMREFNAQYGPAVQVRQIVLRSQAEADRVLAELKAAPESFASVAKNISADPASQPHGGLIRPIRTGALKHPQLENFLFAMKPGEISQVIENPKGIFIIFRCEQHLEPPNIDVAAVRERLELKIRDTKTREISEKVFASLLERSKIEVIFGDRNKMRMLPGVAAVVNGQNVSIKQLSDICLKRYGSRVLNDMINKLLIEQQCRKNNIVITDADIEAEIREMAIKYVQLKPDGTPNTELWMKMALEQNRVSAEIYKRNNIWPVLALKRLTRSMVNVTEDDLQRSFASNYGKKIRCLAIVFNRSDHRRALEVWQKANQRKTPEHFGDLAELYSVDAATRTARGVIPSIGQYCGMPVLEEEAFKLLPNEISQIIQTDDEHLVILFCLGYEEPTITDINDVKIDLAADIFEKKQKLAIASFYEDIFNKAAIDNYLTNESRNPQVEKAIQAGGAGTEIQR